MKFTLFSNSGAILFPSSLTYRMRRMMIFIANKHPCVSFVPGTVLGIRETRTKVQFLPSRIDAQGRQLRSDIRQSGAMHKGGKAHGGWEWQCRMYHWGRSKKMNKASKDEFTRQGRGKEGICWGTAVWMWTPVFPITLAFFFLCNCVSKSPAGKHLFNLILEGTLHQPKSRENKNSSRTWQDKHQGKMPQPWLMENSGNISVITACLHQEPQHAVESWYRRNTSFQLESHVG